MRTNKKTRNIAMAAAMAVAAVFVFLAHHSFASDNPNYGTTTFFSSKKENPVLEKPILGASDNSDDEINYHNGNDNDDNDNGNDHGSGGGIKPIDIFDKIGDAVGAVADNSVNTFTEVKKSLFDLQSDFGFGDSSDSGSSGGGGDDGDNEVFIAGPRGESLQYLASLDKNGEKQTVEFDFADTSMTAAPKKSKLLFTNVEVPVDMTSQYVIVVFIFVLAVCASLGYYYWKKDTSKGKEENYD